MPHTEMPVVGFLTTRTRNLSYKARGYLGSCKEPNKAVGLGLAALEKFTYVIARPGSRVISRIWKAAYDPEFSTMVLQYRSTLYIKGRVSDERRGRGDQKCTTAHTRKNPQTLFSFRSHSDISDPASPSFTMDSRNTQAAQLTVPATGAQPEGAAKPQATGPTGSSPSQANTAVTTDGFKKDDAEGKTTAQQAEGATGDEPKAVEGKGDSKQAKKTNEDALSDEAEQFWKGAEEETKGEDRRGDTGTLGRPACGYTARCCFSF
ncbi:hypothetical protein F4803DRAFT_131998 [Xylaria telfairii]|nr:hypothetical protein F4803DRAFT_131998 [Xylaria telfairii]